MTEILAGRAIAALQCPTDLMPVGFLPIELLRTPQLPVEMLLADGRVVCGWLATHLRTAPRTYWTRRGAVAVTIEPIGWRPQPNLEAIAA